MGDPKPHPPAAGLGLRAGALCAAVGARSPAPPVAALVGRLGALPGARSPSLAGRLRAGRLTLAAARTDRAARVLGPRPTRRAPCPGPAVAP